MDHPKRLKNRPANRLAKERTRLALQRTAMAGDRTLLAWVRTSLSLMTFGFTTYKFFQYLEESGLGQEGWHAVGPRRFGMVLIGLATLLLLSQTWQHYNLLRSMSKARNKPIPKSPALVAALAISLVGVVAFGSVLFGGPIGSA